MPKITNFFVPKIYSLFSCCAYFICSFIRCQTLNILFCVTFIQKAFCVMTFVRYEKRQRKSSGPRGANRTNKKKSNKIGCAHSESLIKTLTWNYGIYSVLKLLKRSHFEVLLSSNYPSVSGENQDENQDDHHDDKKDKHQATVQLHSCSKTMTLNLCSFTFDRLRMA